MDWGKDHYATVTWSDAPDNRRIAIAWMSNWQYANDVPTSQYRSPNSVPRDLSLFTVDGETYLQSAPSPELLKLRDVSKKRSFKVNGTRIIKDMIAGNEGAYEIELTIENQHADIIGFRLYNDKGEEVDIQYDMKEKKFSMDRRKSGDVGFNENFPMLTWTAIESGIDELKLRLFVDKSSVEAFGDGGRFVMTNQVFPSEPYTHIDFYSKGLIDETGKIFRPAAPAIPTPESILTNPLQSGKAYRVFAPTGDEALSVICYNLNTSPAYREVESFVKREDYLLRESTGKSADSSCDSILAFNWEKQSAEVLNASERKIKLSGFIDSLFHLCPIRKGWAVIGIQEKYLSPATVQILKRTTEKLILDVHCTGTLRIWADSHGKQELRSIPIKKAGRIEIMK